MGRLPDAPRSSPGRMPGRARLLLQNARKVKEAAFLPHFQPNGALDRRRAAQQKRFGPAPGGGACMSRRPA